MPKIQPANVHPSDEMEALWESGSGVVQDRIADLAHAMATRNGMDEMEATIALRDAIAGTMAYANLVGRRRVLLETDAMRDDGSLGLSDRVIFTDLDPLIFAEAVPRIPFWTAIKRLLSKEPRLAKTAEEVAEHYRSGNGFSAALAATVNVAKRVRDAIARLMTAGATVPNARDVVAETAGWSKSYAETVYRTNISTAYNEGRREEAKTPGVRAVIGAFRISATRDDDVRRGRPIDHGENHLAADGLTASTTDPLWSTASPPYGYQCFLPGQVVAGSFELGLKAFYSGPSVRIETFDGRSLSVTGNHPVATVRGWVAAKDIAEGDYLLCDDLWLQRLDSSVPVDVGERVNEQNVPARVEDVFDALLSHGASRAISSFAGSLDLHGDAAFTDGDVHVVGTDRVLPMDLDPVVLYSRYGVEFPDADPPSFAGHGPGALDSLGDGDVATATRIPGVRALPTDLGPSVRSRLNFGPLERFGCAPSAHFHAFTDKSVSEGGSSDPEIIRELLEGFPGLVSTKKVRKVVIGSYRGHIYDFQTSTGWIVASGIVTSNCRCVQIMVSRMQLKRDGLLAENGEVIRYHPKGLEWFRSNFKPHPNFASKAV